MPNAVVLIISLLPVVEFGDVVAGNPASQANAKQSCLAATTDELSYRAASLVPMVKTWRASLGAQGRMALGRHIFDKTEFINGRCYWSISFYEPDPAQQRLWKIFRVDVKAEGIFVMDDDGDYLPIYPPAQLK